MSEKSQEVLLSMIDEPPEMDADEFEIEQRFDKAIYESTKIDMIDHIGNEDFKYVWLTSRDDIRFQSIKNQNIFIEQTLDKISEVYDFTFAETPTFENKYQIGDFYKFLEFIEFNNVLFISYVWTIIQPEGIINLDIENYCKTNAMKIIKEVEEQLDIRPQPKLIHSFLAHLYKEAFIDWFIEHTKRNLIDIHIRVVKKLS